MKILLGVPEYPPYHVGGGGEVYKKLAENYKKLGHDVVVVYGYYPTKSWNEKIKEYKKDGIKFYKIPEISYPKSKPFLRTVMPPNFSAYFKLKKIIEKENVEVAHLHGYGESFISVMSKIMRKFDIPYIFSIHGYPETQNAMGLLVRSIYKIYSAIFIKPVLERASIITCVSNFIKNDKRLNKYKSKSKTILNGVDQEEYIHKSRNYKPEIYKELELFKGKDITIFSMGRISKMKGFQLLIDKLNILVNEKSMPLHYIIAGNDGGYLKELQDKVKRLNLQKNVHFIGWKSKSEIISLLNQIDLFAIPSLWDPCPIAAFEGMACNKLIITTESGGIKEILKNYPHKLNIYDKNFDIALLTCIKKTKYRKLRKIDLSDMSWEKVSKRYISVLEKIKWQRK